MTNAAVPSSLPPIKSHTHRPPLSSLFFAPPPSFPLSHHIVIIYPYSDTLFYATIHLSTLLFLTAPLHPSHLHCPIGGLPLIICTWLWLMALICLPGSPSLPPPYTCSPLKFQQGSTRPSGLNVFISSIKSKDNVLSWFKVHVTGPQYSALCSKTDAQV